MRTRHIACAKEKFSDGTYEPYDYKIAWNELKDPLVFFSALPRYSEPQRTIRTYVLCTSTERSWVIPAWLQGPKKTVQFCHQHNYHRSKEGRLQFLHNYVRKFSTFIYICASSPPIPHCSIALTLTTLRIGVRFPFPCPPSSSEPRSCLYTAQFCGPRAFLKKATLPVTS